MAQVGADERRPRAARTGRSGARRAHHGGDGVAARGSSLDEVAAEEAAGARDQRLHSWFSGSKSAATQAVGGVHLGHGHRRRPLAAHGGVEALEQRAAGPRSSRGGRSRPAAASANPRPSDACAEPRGVDQPPDAPVGAARRETRWLNTSTSRAPRGAADRDGEARRLRVTGQRDRRAGVAGARQGAQLVVGQRPGLEPAAPGAHGVVRPRGTPRRSRPDGWRS